MREIALSEEKILVTYDPVEPIELKNFSDSIGALSDEYNQYIRKNYKYTPDRFPEIKIKEIRKGSIIIDLVNNAINSGLFDDFDKINHGVEFFKNLYALKEFFLGKSKEPPPNTTTNTAKNLLDIVNPISKDIGSQINFHASGNSTINVIINQEEASLITKRCQSWIDMQRIPNKINYSEEIFYWWQTRDTFSNRTGDKGIVEKITKKPVNTYISDHDIKARMIEGDIFNKLYLVNLQVDNIEDKPSLYRITDIIDIFDK